MSFTVACQACGARFALPDDLYQRKFKDRLVTVRCKHCGSNISVDGVELASGPQHEIPMADIAIEHTPPVDMTPTVPLADASSDWTVSFDYDDDRELDRDQIARALERGEIDGNTIVWRDGMEDWLPINQVSALADLLSARRDATGGFLGTGMELDAGGAKLKKRPPLHPAKRRSEPPRTGTAAAAKPPLPARAASLDDLGEGKTAGKARALSAGTLFVDDKPAEQKLEPAPKQEKPPRPKLPTAPKAPVPEWKAKLADSPAKIDAEPPSSGTPALTDLTTALKPTPRKPQRAGDDVFGVTNDPGTLLAPPAFDLSPPTIDLESPEPPPAVATDEAEVELESKPAPATTAAETGSGGGVSGRTIGGILLITGALAFSVWWFGFKAPDAASTEPVASAPVASPTPPEPSPTTAENTRAPEPTQSAAPVASSPPAETATAKVAVEPHGIAPSSTSRPVAEKAAPTTAHTSEPTAKTASEPTPPPTPTATATTAKDLPPFSQSAAIAALNSAAGAASACRKEGDPSGMARVVITFAPSGRVTTARVNGPPFAGTATGGCIAARMRGAHVPAFSGDYVTVSKTVIIH